jgi:uncharacterized membrane protein YphA (DoxX/SURF4 family)
MLASYFIASGVKALRDPAPLVPLAEPLADRFVPLVKQYAPDQVAGIIPEDAQSLVRLNGGAQVLGGLALATGKGRRFGALLLAGSLVPSTIAKYPFWRDSDPEVKAGNRTHFLKNISLLGGVLLASRDTEGQPSIAWRAQKGGQSLAKDTRKAAKKLSKNSSSFGDSASDLADSAVAGGAALVGAVVESSRRARKQAAKRLEEAQKAAAKAAKQAKKDAPKQLKAAKKLAAEQAEVARNAAKAAQKERLKQAKSAGKQGKKVRKNISLGEN